MTQASPFLKRGTFTRKKYDRILIATSLAWAVSFIDSCADSLLAGILLSETAVSAVALVQPVTSVISFLAYLISVGTVAMFSRESGAFRKEKAYQYVGQGLICSVAISVFLVIAMILFRDPYLAYYQASDEITEMAKEYFSCQIFLAAVYPIYFVIYQIVDIDGDESCSICSAIASAGTNIVASYILSGIYGIKGLSYGTILGVVAAVIIYLSHFFKKKNSVHAKLHFNIREIGEVIKIGSATAMTLLYVAIIDIVMNRFVIAKFGDAYLPAYAVVNFVLNMGAVFSGLYNACAGFIGVAHGEKNPESIRQTMKISYRGVVVVSALMVILLELIAPYVPDLYGITDEAVRSASVFVVRIIAVSFPALAVYYLFGSYYPLVGYVWLGHLLSIIYMLIAPLVLAIPMGLAFGFDGMSVGFMLTSVAAVVITALVVRIKYGKDAVPLILKNSDEKAIFHELVLSKENITALCDKVNEELSDYGLTSTVRNEVNLILEESYMTIMEYNKGKKVTTECNLLLSDKTLRVITRDNGKIFNITDENVLVKDLRGYVLAVFMEHNPDRTNTTTVSFNRNSYLWQLKE